MDMFNMLRPKGVPNINRYIILIISIVVIIYLNYNKHQAQHPHQYTVETITSRIASTPEDPELYFIRGALYMKSSDFEKSELDFEKSISLGLNNTETKYSLAIASINRHNYGKALRYFRETLPDTRFRLASTLGICTSYLGLKDNNNAIQCLDSAIHLAPGNYSFYILRGQAHANASNPELALKDSSYAVGLAPKNFYTHYFYGLILHNSGDNKKAIHALNTSLEINPKNKDAYCVRAEAYKCLGNNTKAELEYTKSIAVDRKFGRAYIGRASVRYALGNRNGALEDVQKTIDISPRALEPYQLVYDNAAPGEQTEEAVRFFSGLIEKAPENAVAIAYRGLAKAKQDQNYDPSPDFRAACDLGFCQFVQGRPKDAPQW